MNSAQQSCNTPRLRAPRRYENVTCLPSNTQLRWGDVKNRDRLESSALAGRGQRCRGHRVHRRRSRRTPRLDERPRWSWAVLRSGEVARGREADRSPRQAGEEGQGRESAQGGQAQQATQGEGRLEAHAQRGEVAPLAAPRRAVDWRRGHGHDVSNLCGRACDGRLVQPPAGAISRALTLSIGQSFEVRVVLDGATVCIARNGALFAEGSAAAPP